MFNLYQNSSMTRQIIKARQLNLCKLGFCLCVTMGEQFQPVSSWSFSRIIRDGKIYVTYLKIVTVFFFQKEELTVNIVHLLKVKTKRPYLLPHIRECIKWNKK